MLNELCCTRSSLEQTFVLILCSEDFTLIFKYLSLYTSSLSNSFFDTIIIFYQKRHVFRVIKTFYSFQISFGSIILNSLIFFIIFITSEAYETVFIKRNFIRCYYFTNIYITCVDRVFGIVKCMFFNFNFTKSYNFFIYSLH